MYPQILRISSPYQEVKFCGTNTVRSCQVFVFVARFGRTTMRSTAPRICAWSSPVRWTPKMSSPLSNQWKIKSKPRSVTNCQGHSSTVTVNCHLSILIVSYQLSRSVANSRSQFSVYMISYYTVDGILIQNSEKNIPKNSKLTRCSARIPSHHLNELSFQTKNPFIWVASFELLKTLMTIFGHVPLCSDWINFDRDFIRK